MTIEEMAKDYGKANPNTYLDADGNIEKDIYMPAVDYESGAIDVLKEFEEIIAMGYEEVSTYELIENKIKELKGE